MVRKTLVNQGSSTDVLYWNTFNQLEIPKVEFLPYDKPLVGFSGKRESIGGWIELYNKFGHGEPNKKAIKIR